MKNSPDRYTKKIVSKGKYAQVQGHRALVMLVGSLLFLLAGLCAFITLCLLIVTVYSVCTGTKDGVVTGIFGGILTASGGLLTFGFVKACRAAAAEAEGIDNVVPLTRTTAPYLPVQESLVRASAEPPVASETILLRAVGDISATPPEQLVRPSHTPD